MTTTRPSKPTLMWEIIITSFIILAVILFTALFEKPLTYNDGLGWDGAVYYNMAQQFRNGEQLVNEAPFVYRLGIPYLAAKLFPDNLLSGFRTINLAGSILSIIFLLIFLRKYVNNSAIRMLLIALYATHWLGPLRTTLFYPTQIEPASTAISLLAFILIARLDEKPSLWRAIGFGIVSLLGALTRESYILIPLIYMLSQMAEATLSTSKINLSSLRHLSMSIIPVLFGLFGMLLTRMIATPDNVYTFSGMLLFWMYQKPFLAYILGYFITFGPLLTVFFPSGNVIKKHLTKHRFHLYYLFAIPVLAWVIGSDTDRFLFWAAPIWLVLLGQTLEYLSPLLTKSVGLCVFIVLVQCLSQRSFLPTPDYAPDIIEYRIPALTVLCNDGCSLDIVSYHGWTGTGVDAAFCSIKPCIVNGDIFPIKWYQLLEYIFVCGLILLGIMRRQRIVFGSQAIT